MAPLLCPPSLASQEIYRPAKMGGSRSENRHLELHPPLRLRSSTEIQRIAETIEQRGATLGASSSAKPVLRDVNHDKWVQDRDFMPPKRRPDAAPTSYVHAARHAEYFCNILPGMSCRRRRTATPSLTRRVSLPANTPRRAERAPARDGHWPRATTVPSTKYLWRRRTSLPCRTRRATTAQQQPCSSWRRGCRAETAARRASRFSRLSQRMRCDGEQSQISKLIFAQAAFENRWAFTGRGARGRGS
jgi:hypothetical protein